MEWYNLAKQHGYGQFYLHDDFYDASGIAHQAEGPVKGAKQFPAPTLAEVGINADRLIEYANVHSGEPIVLEALRAIPRRRLLAAAKARFAAVKSASARSSLVWTCAGILREGGAEFVRLAWRELPGVQELPTLSYASQQCLPFREAFDRVLNGLEKVERKRRGQWGLFCLESFHAAETFDWIEKHLCQPLDESWGNLAAASRITWQRVQHWLGMGRPHSLIALDALAAIAEPQSVTLQEYGPRLHEPPSADRMRRFLSEYQASDNVPRVGKRIRLILKNAETLCKRE